MATNKNNKSIQTMKVVTAKDPDNNNKPFVAIVDEHYLPITPWVSNYLTIHLSGTAFSTQHNYAKQLKVVLEYFRDRKIDIEERVISGMFFRTAELEAFFNFCKFKASASPGNVVEIDVYKTDKAIENALHASKVAKALAAATTGKGKLLRFMDFILFMYTYVHSDNMVPAEVQYRYDLVKSFLDDKMGQLKDFNEDCQGEGESPLPTPAYLDLLDILRPESPKNPFKRSKLRNYLMVHLYLETGNRRGDHGGLKIEDCKLHGSFDEISIVRRPNDPDDKRKIIAATKTKGHKSSVPKSLMTEVEKYIIEVRSLYPKSKHHPYVFVTENNSKGTAGEALSLSMINKVFDKLSKAIGFHVHPHLMRYKFNEILTEIAEREGLSHEETDKMRKYMMGWTRDSEMAEIYNRFKNYQTAQKFNALRQEKMTDAGKDTPTEDKED